MLTRRTLLEWLGSVTGLAATGAGSAAAAAASAVAAPRPGSYAALLGQPVQWVFDDASGSFEPAIDFFKSYDWHIPQEVLDRARTWQIMQVLSFRKMVCVSKHFFDRTTGRCVWIKYWGVAGDQAGALVDLNTQGSTWGPPRTTRVNAAGMKDTVTNWHREDGALATSSVFLRVLEIKTKDVMDNKSRQDEETRKRDRGRSVEGF